MTRTSHNFRLLLALVVGGSASLAWAAPKNAQGVWTDSNDSSLPADFHIQGEYVSDSLGCQVIALSGGSFQAVVYPGGLPGAGWDGKNKSLLDGQLQDGKAVFSAVSADAKKRYLAGPAKDFSATRKFPPNGHQAYSGEAASGKLTLKHQGETWTLKRTARQSETLGKKPPQGAKVLFDGSNADHWNGGRLDKKTKLLNTDGKDIRTKDKFNNYVMHVEFMLPYRPAARGQGRGNSGFYQVDHYEVQILDSFGLEGLNNECGGVYQKADSLVNMCLAPLTWQTYDVEFTNAVADKDGKKTKNAVMTVRLNGVVIHDKLEVNGKTGGSRREREGTPGPIKLQGHGNPLQFRNVWIIEK